MQPKEIAQLAKKIDFYLIKYGDFHKQLRNESKFSRSIPLTKVVKRDRGTGKFTSILQVLTRSELKSWG